MPDMYINDLQLNTGNLTSIIPKVRNNRRFKNRSKTFITNAKNITHPISADSPLIDLEITLLASGDVWDELIEKETEIYDEFMNQAILKEPVRIRTTTNSYLNHNDYFIIVEDVDYKRKGVDGNNFLTFNVSGFLYGVSIFNGGTIDPENPWNPVFYANAIGSQTYSSFLIGTA